MIIIVVHTLCLPVPIAVLTHGTVFVNRLLYATKLFQIGTSSFESLPT